MPATAMRPVEPKLLKLCSMDLSFSKNKLMYQPIRDGETAVAMIIPLLKIIFSDILKLFYMRAYLATKLG